jgi:FAD/FMN-containing dehydrogenase
MVLYPRSQASDVLKFYRDFTAAAPDELVTYAGLFSAPDRTPVAAIIVCHSGERAEGERTLAPLRKFGSPMLDAIQPMPFPAMQSLLDGAAPDGNQNYWKSTFLRELSDDAIATIVAYGNEATSPLSAVLVEQYGGAVSRVPDTATAFAHRQAEYDLVVMGQWVDPGESARHISWTRRFAEAMVPFRSGAYLLNALGEESEDVVRAAFGVNYERLAAVKAQYDPTNFFRVNQNVPPAAPTVGA